MRITDNERASTTVLPPAAPHSSKVGALIHPKLKPLCSKRMADAAEAEAEVAKICEEISQVMRKLPEKQRPARGNSNRPSVPRRRVRKADR